MKVGRRKARGSGSATRPIASSARTCGTRPGSAPTRPSANARLGRELDRLQALGVSNLRILASAELSPLRNSVRPAFRDAGARYDQTLLGGLDFALAEIARRGMRAVLHLTNFGEWSGGIRGHAAALRGN